MADPLFATDTGLSFGLAALVEPPTFLDSLSATLTLTFGSTAVTIAAGDIKRFDLRIFAFGFTGEVEFWIVCRAASEDTLFDAYVGRDLGLAALSLVRTLSQQDGTPTAVTVTGVVTTKQVYERAVAGVVGAPVLTRRYLVRFADRASVLWKLHRPTQLYVDKSYEAIFTGNAIDGITVTHSWAASTATHAVLALGLGADENAASYYDFVFWLLGHSNAGVTYDVAASTYAIIDTKPTSSKSKTLDQAQVASLEAYFPSARRDTVRVANSYTEASTRTKDGTNASSATGVRSDFLMRSKVEADLTDRSTTEGTRASQREHELLVWLNGFPESPVLPQDSAALGDGFSAALFCKANTYRVVEAHVTGAAEQGSAGDNMWAESNRYRCTYGLRLELAANPIFCAPATITPRWPFEVEGNVVSETGEAAELTYQVYQDTTTSIDQYKVKVPLFDSQVVVAAFEPVTLPGHLYFPSYKDERVLVALGFDYASVVGFLDWRPGVRTPIDGQGNQLLMGKQATDQTSIAHVYEDAKPKLTILRNKDGDQQTLRMSDGDLFIEVKESS
jgi:hypothetical protein